MNPYLVEILVNGPTMAEAHQRFRGTDVSVFWCYGYVCLEAACRGESQIDALRDMLRRVEGVTGDLVRITVVEADA